MRRWIGLRSRSRRQLDSSLRPEHTMPNRVLSDHQGALSADLVLSLHTQVEQLHGADRARVHHQTHSVGEVARILVVSTGFEGARSDVLLRQVVGLDDGDTSHTDYVTIRVATLTAPRTVNNLGALRQSIELGGTDEERAVLSRNVFLIEHLGGLEHSIGQRVTIRRV